MIKLYTVYLMISLTFSHFKQNMNTFTCITHFYNFLMDTKIYLITVDSFYF